ncbi:hypothetical protein FOCC_FOCC016280 [Frankliniella occidentalis]|nr:hypothetical protein FOCC_FOCC016280 [Frankliniella occidentalis]
MPAVSEGARKFHRFSTFPCDCIPVQEITLVPDTDDEDDTDFEFPPNRETITGPQTPPRLRQNSETGETSEHTYSSVSLQPDESEAIYSERDLTPQISLRQGQSRPVTLPNAPSVPHTTPSQAVDNKPSEAVEGNTSQAVQNSLSQDVRKNHSEQSDDASGESAPSQPPKKVNVARFECEACDKQYASKNGLRAHIQAIHDKKQFKYDECGKRFSRRSSLHTHMHVHKGRELKCAKCGQEFKRNANLVEHFFLKHEKKSDYECQSCGKLFYRAFHLERHVRALHPRL